MPRRTTPKSNTGSEIASVALAQSRAERGLTAGVDRARAISSTIALRYAQDRLLLGLSSRSGVAPAVESNSPVEDFLGVSSLGALLRLAISSQGI